MRENEKIKKNHQDLMLKWTKNCKIKMKELDSMLTNKIEEKINQETKSFQTFQIAIEDYIQKFSKDINYDLGSIEAKIQNTSNEIYLKKDDFFTEVNLKKKKLLSTHLIL